MISANVRRSTHPLRWTKNLLSIRIYDGADYTGQYWEYPAPYSVSTVTFNDRATSVRFFYNQSPIDTPEQFAAQKISPYLTFYQHYGYGGWSWTVTGSGNFPAAYNNNMSSFVFDANILP